VNILQSDKKSILVLFIIYLIVNTFLLLNYNGIYWDDWVIYNNEYEAIYNMFFQHSGNAGKILSPLYYFLLNIGNGILSYRILTVLLLFLSAIFIFKILKNIPQVSNKDRFYIVLFILIAPLYSAKVALIDFLYTFHSAIFFFAFYLLSKYLNNLENMKRIFILGLFSISFIVNSLLVYYAIVLIYMFYMLYSYENTFFKNLFIFIRTKIDFILLPVAFYIIKSIYFMPSGIYAGYNSIKLSKVLSVDTFYKTFELNFIDPIVTSLLIKPFIILLVVLFILGLFLRQNKHMQKKDLYLFSFGFLAFFLGAFAYIAVGKIPSLYNWASRLQVLLPLGFSFMLYYGIQIIFNLLNFKEVIKLFTYFILFLSFMTFHIKEQIKYNIDWMYQQSIIENFKINETIKNNSTFIVKNEIGDKLVDSRRLGFYQLNGMAKVAFGDDKRFFPTSEKELKKFEEFKIHKHYNFSTWEFGNPVSLILKVNPESEFNKDSYESLKYLLRLKYLELVNEEIFISEIKELVYFDFEGKK
jgi:hypothetical protein